MHFFVESHSDTESSNFDASELGEIFTDHEEDKANVLRVEETIYRSWSGVRSCGDTDRVKAEIDAAIQAWVGQKLLEYVNHQVLRYGAGDASVSTRNSGGSGFPRSPRRCSGSASIPCFIEFKKP
jgi:hypothetical protein